MVVGAYGPEAELRAGSPQGETLKISGGQRVLRNKALGIAGVTVLSSGIGLLIHGSHRRGQKLQLAEIQEGTDEGPPPHI